MDGMTDPELEPVSGTYIDAEGDEQPETWWVIRGPFEVCGESNDEITIRPRRG